VSSTIDIDTRDTHWYKIQARDEEEINGSFEIRNFNSGDPTERDINIWIFPTPSAATRSPTPGTGPRPQRAIEPISIMAPTTAGTSSRCAG